MLDPRTLVFARDRVPTLSYRTREGEVVVLKKRRLVEVTVEHEVESIAHLYHQVEELEPPAPATPLPTTTSLWAEAHRPSRVTELVGNEKNHRHVLHWLRQWNKAVFHTHVEQPPGDLPNTDPLQRPYRKILLLAGPPGVGKTTAAHVLAGVMGYEVREINASDERAGSNTKDRIHTVLTLNSFAGKPTVLVADEIDGAAEHGFIRVLVDLVARDSRAVAALHKDAGTKTKLLSRPVIAICNDLYAPVLERLRPLCEVVQFRPPSAGAVRSHFSAILRQHHLTLPAAQLLEVVGQCAGDIRAGLNALQFQGPSGHRKDQAPPWFKVLDLVFVHTTDPLAEQCTRLLRTVDQVAQQDRLVGGCFEAYANTSEASLAKAAAVADALYFYDRTARAGGHHDGFDAAGYGAASVLEFWRLFGDANNSHRQLRTPGANPDYEAFVAHQATRALVAQAGAVLPPSLRVVLPPRDLASVSLPLVGRVLIPGCSSDTRTVARPKVAKAAALMRQLKMRVELRKRDGTTVWSTSPNWSVFVPSDLNTETALRAVAAEMRGGGKGTEAVKQKPLVDVFAAYSKEEPARAGKHTRVWVKYHEGYSDAVRKNVTWRQLWGQGEA